MEQLIHITATYSNALLVAILPHVSGFAKTLNLPISQPVTVEHVSRFNPSPYKGHMAGAVWLTNGYWFSFSPRGYVDAFRSPSNWFAVQGDISAILTNYSGETRMTTNEIVALARETLLKLHYPPEVSRTDLAPLIEGPYNPKQGGHIPFSRVAWRIEDTEDFSDVHLDINTQDKTVVGLSLLFARTNKVGTPLKLGVEPELEADYRKRIQGTMFVRTNLPPGAPPKKPPGSAP